MTDQSLKKRREALEKRLTKQIRQYNKELLLQNINIFVSMFVVFPLLIAAVLFLFGVVFDKATDAAQIQPILQFKEFLFSFVMSNEPFHIIITTFAVFVVCMLVFYQFAASIRLTSKQMNLATYVLAVSKQHQLLKYKAIHKELEFRAMSYKEFDKVTNVLQILKHIAIESFDTVEEKTIIRISDW